MLSAGERMLFLPVPMKPLYLGQRAVSGVIASVVILDRDI